MPLHLGPKPDKLPYLLKFLELFVLTEILSEDCYVLEVSHNWTIVQFILWREYFLQEPDYKKRNYVYNCFTY